MNSRYSYNKNKRVPCNQGHKHDSKFEAGYCNTLALLVKAGEIRSYERQVTYKLVVNGKKITGHRIDFVVTRNDGSLEVNEVKGFANETWEFKRRLFEALYPNISYIVIKMKGGFYGRRKQSPFKKWRR